MTGVFLRRGLKTVVVAHAGAIFPPGRSAPVVREWGGLLGLATAESLGRRLNGGLSAGEPFGREDGRGAQLRRGRQSSRADGTTEDADSNAEATRGLGKTQFSHFAHKK